MRIEDSMIKFVERILNSRKREDVTLSSISIMDSETIKLIEHKIRRKNDIKVTNLT